MYTYDLALLKIARCQYFLAEGKILRCQYAHLGLIGCLLSKHGSHHRSRTRLFFAKLALCNRLLFVLYLCWATLTGDSSVCLPVSCSTLPITTHSPVCSLASHEPGRGEAWKNLASDETGSRLHLHLDALAEQQPRASNASREPGRRLMQPSNQPLMLAEHIEKPKDAEAEVYTYEGAGIYTIKRSAS